MGQPFLRYSHVLRSEHERWKPFQWAFSKEDQSVFDRFFDGAKFHTHAGFCMAHSWPLETTLPIFLKRKKTIEEVLGKLK
jgi:hypothetical protein